MNSHPADLRAISLQQPWAWLVVNGWKTFENRTRRMAPPGVYLVHASAKCTPRQHKGALAAIKKISPRAFEDIPERGELERPGIVGLFALGQWCATKTRNKWSWGSGYPILWARSIPFVECPGKLGVFSVQVPMEIPRYCRQCGCTDDDCLGCIARTGDPCHWVALDLCSACKE